MHFIAIKPSRQPFGCSITVNLMCFSATSSKCCFRPSLAEPMVSSFLRPSGALRYQCGPAHWHSTTCKTDACLPKFLPKPNITAWHKGGRGWTQQHTKNSKHFLKYAVTPLKYRLPTWRLHTTKPYASTPHRTPPDAVRLVQSVWFSQRPLVTRQQRGEETATYCVGDTLWLTLVWQLVIMLKIHRDVGVAVRQVEVEGCYGVQVGVDGGHKLSLMALQMPLHCVISLRSLESFTALHFPSTHSRCFTIRKKSTKWENLSISHIRWCTFLTQTRGLH